MKNLNKKIILHENNLNNLQNKLNSCNGVNLRMQKNIKKMEIDLDNERNENKGLKNILINERSLRGNIANNNERLKNILAQKEKELNQLHNENRSIKLINAQYNKSNDINKIRNDKLKNQVIILESQNNTLIN